MVTVDLITGFLGAGKTTFIHSYLHFLKEKNQKVIIIENEFGETSIDSEMLRDEGCEIHDLAGMCMCCVGKDAFIRMLAEASEQDIDRIIVEPSGIYDVDEFFEVLSLPGICDRCEIGSIITIAAPGSFTYLTDESKYLMFGQFLASGMILVSKTDGMSVAELEAVDGNINQLMADFGCEGGVMADVMTKPWSELTDSDFEDIMEAGYFRMVHDREEFSHSETFQSGEFMLKGQSIADLESKVRRVFESPSCGVVYRIKGYARTTEGQWFEVNCTAETYSIKQVSGREGTVVVIGQQIREREIREILR